MGLLLYKISANFLLSLIYCSTKSSSFSFWFSSFISFTCLYNWNEWIRSTFCQYCFIKIFVIFFDTFNWFCLNFYLITERNKNLTLLVRIPDFALFLKSWKQYFAYLLLNYRFRCLTMFTYFETIFCERMWDKGKKSLLNHGAYNLTKSFWFWAHPTSSSLTHAFPWALSFACKAWISSCRSPSETRPGSCSFSF